jgi:hypothetical protein
VVEHYNAVVDIGSSGGVVGARFIRMPTPHADRLALPGGRPQCLGLGAWAPCGGPRDALGRFVDRWLGPGQGLFCSVLSIARDDARSAAPGPHDRADTPR